MHPLSVMTPIKKIRWNRVLKQALRALPEIPYVNEKPKTSALPYVLGAIGFAVVGGVAAVMFFSPKTRMRALDVAKDVTDKAKGTIGHTAIGEKLGFNETPKNGLRQSEQSYANGL